MDISKRALTILINNSRLAIICIGLSITIGIIHYLFQTEQYVSKFISNNGLINSEYLKNVISFDKIDPDDYTLTTEYINENKTLLEDISIKTLFTSNTHIHYTLISKTDQSENKAKIENFIIKLVNNTKGINFINENLNKKSIQRSEYITAQIKIYNEFLNTTLVNKNTKKYIKIENRLSQLTQSMIKLKNKIENTGKIYTMIPIKNFESLKKPLLVFMFLYLILGIIIFTLLSKKEINESI